MQIVMLVVDACLRSSLCQQSLLRPESTAYVNPIQCLVLVSQLELREGVEKHFFEHFSARRATGKALAEAVGGPDRK